MTADPRIFIRGPIDENGDPTGEEVPLYLGDEARDETSTETEAEDIPTAEAQDRKLSPITGERSFNTQGVINGTRLQQAGYGADPIESIREYLFQLESLIRPQQGNGYVVEDTVRDKIVGPDNAEVFDGEEDRERAGVLIDTVRWEFNSDESPRGSWTVEGQTAEGVQNADSRVEYVSDQRDRVSDLEEDKVVSDGIEIPLGEVETRRFERNIDIEAQDLVHQFDVEQVGVIESGVKAEVNWDGRIADRQVDGDLWELARQLTDEVHGQTAEVHDVLTGRVYSGAFSSTSTTINEGEPNHLNYSISLDVGEVTFE